MAKDKKKEDKKAILGFMKADIKKDKELVKGVQSGKKSPKEVLKSEKNEPKFPKLPKKGKK